MRVVLTLMVLRVMKSSGRNKAMDDWLHQLKSTDYAKRKCRLNPTCLRISAIKMCFGPRYMKLFETVQ